MTRYYLMHPSPLGDLLLTADETALTGVLIARHDYIVPDDWTNAPQRAVLRQTCVELDAYFAGRGRNFTVPLAPRGSEFQQRAWAALRDIPYGETRSYGQQAATLGHARAVRAVGAANGKNPIGIIIPCHRVIGANGSLTGYAGGLPAKRFLLELEAGVACRQPDLLSALVNTTVQ